MPYIVIGEPDYNRGEDYEDKNLDYKHKKSSDSELVDNGNKRS